MKKVWVFFVCLILFSILLSSSYSEEQKKKLSPPEIMDKYGKAVVLLAMVKDNKEIGLGSGFIVKSEGVIVTNYHVIENAYPALVKLKNGDVYEDIYIIDFNEREDIAVIKVKGWDLPAVELGNSNDIKIGESVVVIGNPHGFENTISDGLLSQVRETELGYKLYQMTAPISPGSSGSAVFNQFGEVIGIATLSDMEGQNLNFFVPINYVRGMIDSPVKYSLREFVNLEKQPSVLREGMIATKTLSNKEFLTELNRLLTYSFRSLDIFQDGFLDTVEPHTKRFNPQKYAISYEIYSAHASLKKIKENLQEISSSDSELEKMKDKLLQAVEGGRTDMSNIISALEHKESNSSGVFYVPNWNEANANVARLRVNWSATIEKKYIVSFVERIRKDTPELENEILSIFTRIYNDKDKTEQEIIDENKDMGRLQIEFYPSYRQCVIGWITEKGPAYRAGLKRNDIILGVEKGKDFNTQLDYNEFQKTTHPGQRVTFRIERERKITTKTVTLER